MLDDIKAEELTDDKHRARRSLQGNSAHRENCPAPVNRIREQIHNAYALGDFALFLDSVADLVGFGIDSGVDRA